jgi:hypothetical protein
MNAFIIELPNQPGSLADIAEAIAERGINIAGVAGATVGDKGSISILTNDESATKAVLDDQGVAYRSIGLVSAALEDRPGTLASATRRLAGAGINIESLFVTGMDGGKIMIAIGVSDVDGARQALGELATARA